MTSIVVTLAALGGALAAVFFAYLVLYDNPRRESVAYQNSQELIAGIDALLGEMKNAPNDQIHQLKEAKRHLEIFRRIIADMPLSFRRRAS